MTQLIRLGSRRSPLALAQAHITSEKIRNLYPNIRIEIVEIETTGDKNQIDPLSAIGGKGVFIRELETALIDNRIDIAVHSLKDVTSNTYPELSLFGFFKAESVKDALISNTGYTLTTLPQNARIGTGSMRRKALLRHFRPDITTVDIRGNIATRLSHLDRGIDAILLSEVSLMRLNIQTVQAIPLLETQFIPAPGQGVIALEARNSDPIHIRICKEVSHPIQYIISNAQISFLKAVGFDCQTPLGMHSTIVGKQFQSILFRSSSDLTQTEFTSFTCPIQDCIDVCRNKGVEWKSTPL